MRLPQGRRFLTSEGSSGGGPGEEKKQQWDSEVEEVGR